MNLVKKLVAVTILHVCFVTGELYEGDVCPLKDGNSGICKYLSECPEAISSIRAGILPENCGYKGTQFIVCCEQATTVTPEPPIITPRPTTVIPIPTTPVTRKPTAPVTREPTTVTPEPPTITPEPTTVIAKSTSPVTPKPTTPVTKEPTTVTPEPPTITPEPTTVIPKPTSPVTPKPTTPVTKEATTVTPEPPTITPKPTTPVTPKPTTPVTKEPTTVTPEPPTKTPEPTTVTPKPTSHAYTKNRLPGEISNQKCLEYSAFVWSEGLNPTLLPGGGSIKINDCPFIRQELVVGGVAATKREFPHMVQLGYDSSAGLTWTCGGSLISGQYVLTAAHCLSPRTLGDAKYARMGLVNLQDVDTMQKYNIAELIPHPQFEEPSHYHDIGLAKLKRQVEINSWVRPACLYIKNHSPWSHVIAAGWGQTDSTAAGPQSEVLRRAILELFRQPQCNRTHRRQIGTNTLMDGVKDDIMICAGHSKELIDTCQGDSGGPLQVYKNGKNDLSCMYEVVGVTSFGRVCGLLLNAPAIYTRVSYYTKWIEDIVWPAI